MANDEIKSLAARLEALEIRVTKLEGGRPASRPAESAVDGAKQSLREFLISKKPGDDVKRSLAVAYYLLQFSGMTSVSIADIEAGFDRAKEKKPLNMNDKINMSIRNGHLDEAEEKKNSRKAWVLTTSGRVFVENGFKR